MSMNQNSTNSQHLSHTSIPEIWHPRVAPPFAYHTTKDTKKKMINCLQHNTCNIVTNRKEKCSEAEEICIAEMSPERETNKSIQYQTACTLGTVAAEN